MTGVSQDDGLSVVDGSEPADGDELPEEVTVGAADLDGHADLETLCDEFVAGFNARDMEALLALVADDVETPDIAGDGQEQLAEELEAIWERSPGAILTRALLDGVPCSMAWLPDEDGCWSRAALVCFDAEEGLLTLVAVPDDADALDRAEAADPTGEEIDEWSDWAEWERGEETRPRPRGRNRP